MNSPESRPALILVVEDNIVNQKVVTTLLRRGGYEVVVANHGAEALECLESREYDLVLMDLQMPVMDGILATQRIRGCERWAKLPVVALTANALPEASDRCRAAGMNGFLTKPINSSLLVKMVSVFTSATRDLAALGEALEVEARRVPAWVVM